MTQSERRLVSLLSGEGRTLANVRFFLGENGNHSADELFDAASNAISMAIEGAGAVGVPMTAKPQVHIGKLLD